MLYKNKFIGIICCLLLLVSCDPNNYLEDLYVKPQAAFEIQKETYEVFESVVFANKGTGQHYVVYPGDDGHVYDKEGNTGYATASNGTFSYSYREPGTYNVVWIASSMNANGEREASVDSVKINVLALDGGLDKFVIYNIYKLNEYATGGLSVYYSSYGEFISPDTLLCPILFASWRDATFNSIKAKQVLNFSLSSNSARMYWVNGGQESEVVSMSTTRIVTFVENNRLTTQNFRVKTASGVVSDYYMAPVMIPQFTKFSINGVEAEIARDLGYYEIYDVNITLPSGTDLTQLVPEFEVMNNDANLLGENNCKVTIKNVVQQSGISKVDFSKGTVEYRIDYQMLGSSNTKLTQHAIMRVNVTRQ